MAQQEQKKEKKAPVLILELVDRQGGGWFQEDSIDTREPIEKDSPSNRSILRESVIKQVLEEGGYINIPIRHVYGCAEIIKSEQEKMGVKTNPNRDMIIFKNGRLVVERTGSFVGLYDYLKRSSMNDSNPDRVPSVDKVYREVDLDVPAQEFSDVIFEASEAILFLKPLQKKNAEGEYEYQEEKIDGLSELFGIVGETPAHKLRLLIEVAHKTPTNFLKIAKKAEAQNEIQIRQAMELGVIVLEPTRFIWAKKQGDALVTFMANITQEKKINKLSDKFASTDGRALYNEFLVELEAAKELQTT